MITSVRTVAALLSGSALFVAAPAHAQAEAALHRQLRLSWVRSDAADSCPDASEVQRDVETRLGWSPFVHDNRRSETVEALVTREGSTWRAHIQLRDPDGGSLGSRDVMSPAQTCDSLAATAALAIALIIEPMLPATPPTPPPPSKPAPAPRPIAPAPATRARGRENSSTRTERSLQALQGGVALGATAAVNVLPGLAAGPTLGADVRLFERVFARARASFFPQRDAHGSTGSVAFGLTLGSLGACYHVPLSRAWHASGCASAWLGSLDVTVRSPTPIAPGARTWWAGSLGASTGVRLGSAEIALEIAALDHLARHTYVIDSGTTLSAGSVFTEPAFAALTTLSAGVRF